MGRWGWGHWEQALEWLRCDADAGVRLKASDSQGSCLSPPAGLHYSFFPLLILLIYDVSGYGRGTTFGNSKSRGAWVAWSVKHPTFGFSSGHDLQVS